MGVKRKKARKHLDTPRLPLAPSQVRVLEVLAEEPVQRSSQEVAQLTRIDQPSIYTILARLRQGGYIETTHERRPGDDGRCYYFALCRLTGKGAHFIRHWRAFLESLGQDPRAA